MDGMKIANPTRLRYCTGQSVEVLEYPYGGVQWCWTIRYIGSPGMGTVGPHRVKGGRRVSFADIRCEHAAEVHFVVTMSTSCSPSHATEKEKKSTALFERYKTQQRITRERVYSETNPLFVRIREIGVLVLSFALVWELIFYVVVIVWSIAWVDLSSGYNTGCCW